MNQTQIIVTISSTDYTLDLYEKTVFALTKKVNDFADITKFDGALSNNISLPKSNNNIKYLGHPGSVASSITRYQKFSCKVYQNGIDILSGRGYLVVNRVTDSIEVTVYDNFIDFFTLIADKTIKEIADIAPTKIDWTETNILNSITNDYTQIYKFPFTKNTTYSMIDDVISYVNCRYLLPCVFTRTLIDSLITTAGYTYSWKYVEPSEFPKLMIQLNEKLNDDTITDVAQETNYDTTIGIVVGFPIYYFMQTLNPSTAVYDCVGTVGANDCFIIPFTGDYNLKFTGTFVENVNATTILTLDVYKYTINTDETEPESVYTETFSYNGLESRQITPTQDLKGLKKGDKLVLRFSSNGDISHQTGSKWEIISALITESTYGGYWKPSRQLPDMEQKELMREILFRFGAMIQFTGATTMEFFTFADLYNNRNNGYDWSQKVYPSTIIRDHNPWNYAIQNYLRSDNQSWLPDAYLDYAIESNNQALKQKQDLFKSVFGNCKTGTRFDIDETPLINKIKVEFVARDDSGGTVFMEQKQSWEDIKPMLLLDDWTSSGSAGLYEDLDANGDPVLIDTAGDVAKCQYVNWQTWYDNYLIYIEQMLTNPLKITCQVDLSILEFTDFDFSRPVYIDFLSAHFFVSRINNWQVGKSCEVELIKM